MFKRFLLSAALILGATTTQAAYWKPLGKNLPLGDGINGDVYYDKDSIAHPDASAASVWVRYAFPNKEVKIPTGRRGKKLPVVLSQECRGARSPD